MVALFTNWAKMMALVAMVMVATALAGCRPAVVPSSAAAGTATAWTWAGTWLQSGGEAALIRLRHNRGGTLAGDYAPAGDRPDLYPLIGGQALGDVATFDVRMKGKLWHFRMTHSGATATLEGWRDLDGLVDDYGHADGRMGGVIVISPRTPKEHAKDKADLAKRREEMLRAATPAVMGTFERVETSGG